ncbi:MAG: response regulator PleD [Methanobacterium sp. PtaU1.Bin097]|jgi:chemotaxis family two-component system response regulator Rcp1|nr:MAG: response regulator PleD [Methanobacterium sp. PtaU1.Bin097]
MNIGKKGKNKPIEILLIEDNLGDNKLTTEVFQEAAVPNIIHMVTNGVDAMNFLKQEGGFQDSDRPNIILLDLNIPKKDGREILKEIKADPELKYIPIIVLTNSESEQDIKNTYKHYANAYITKPIDMDEFVKVIKSIEEYWLRTVELPP